MSVKAVFGTFEITGLALKNVDELSALIDKIQDAGSNILQSVVAPGNRGRLSNDFSLEIEEKTGEFDD